MTFTHTITSKGQITIPKAIRRQLGLKPGGQATFRLKPGGEAVLVAPMTLEQVREMLKVPAGAGLSTKEKLILEGMNKDGRQAFR